MTDFNLKKYLEEGLLETFRGMTRISTGNPKAALFAARFIKGAKKAAAKREQSGRDGLPVPPFLIASITGQCNLSCAGCYARARGESPCRDVESKDAMTDGEFLGLFRQAEEAGISFILLAGGEPLLRRPLIQGAGEIPGILFPIFTNGTLLDREYLGLFAAKRNLIPILSLEGGRGATDRKRGTGTYEALTKVMERLKASRILFGVSVTVDRNNMEEVLGESFLEGLKRQGCRAVIFVEYVPMDRESQSLELGDSHRTRMLERLDFLRNGPFRDFLIIAFPGDEAASGGCLAAGRGFFHINYDGSAEPCPFSPFSDTNLKTATLREALASNLFQSLAKEGLLTKPHTGGCVLFGQEGEVRRMAAATGEEAPAP